MAEMDPSEIRWYVDRALDEMLDMLRALGDELANEAPALPGANSPFATLTHCLGVMEYWGGEMIAGRPVVRDRAAEFEAKGTIDEISSRVSAARKRFGEDLEQFDASAPPRGTVREHDVDLPLGRTQSGVALHVFEELYQHLGQMEITRDLLVAVAGQVQ